MTASAEERGARLAWDIWQCNITPAEVQDVLRHDIDFSAGAVYNPLSAAIMRGNVEIAGMLVNAGAASAAMKAVGGVNDPVTLAAIAPVNRAELMSLLIEAGLPVDRRNQDGSYAIQQAFTRGYADVFGMLAERQPRLLLLEPSPGVSFLEAAPEKKWQAMEKIILAHVTDGDCYGLGKTSVALRAKRFQPGGRA